MEKLFEFLRDVLKLLQEVKEQQVNDANKNDENYHAVLDMLEREKTEKAKAETLLKECGQALISAKNKINNLEDMTFSTEIDKKSLDVLSKINDTFNEYTEEKKIERTLESKREEEKKEMESEEESSIRMLLWGSVALTIVFIVLMVTIFVGCGIL